MTKSYEIPQENKSLLLSYLNNNTQSVMSPCIITICIDQSLRFWTISGQHIGRFGKTPLWDLKDPRSWSHRQHRYKLPPNTRLTFNNTTGTMTTTPLDNYNNNKTSNNNNISMVSNSSSNSS